MCAYKVVWRIPQPQIKPLVSKMDSIQIIIFKGD